MTTPAFAVREDTGGPLSPGDFVYTSWGYDQTQVDFYRVEALTPSGKSARVVRVWMRDVGAWGSMHRALVPSSTPVEGAKVTTHRILDDRGTLKIHGHYAWPWNGKPKYATGHGYGH